jgi:hypothetical protein
MKITYSTTEEFYTGIYELTKRGLTFLADGNRLVVELTGGY